VKRLVLPVILFVAALFATLTPVGHIIEHVSLAAVAEAQQDPAKITVYITKTGEKYHRDGCSSLRRSKFAVSLKEAVARGYGARKNCRPPTVR
jgi:hypothetical protein